MGHHSTDDPKLEIKVDKIQLCLVVKIINSLCSLDAGVLTCLLPVIGIIVVSLLIIPIKYVFFSCSDLSASSNTFVASKDVKYKNVLVRSET